MSTPPQPPSLPPVPPEDDDDARSAAAAAEFNAALEAFERERDVAAATAPQSARGTAPALRVGLRMSCRIVAVSGDSLLLDIGGRSEAVADAAEFRAEDGTLTVAAG